MNILIGIKAYLKNAPEGERIGAGEQAKEEVDRMWKRKAEEDKVANVLFCEEI